jgi:hypothetical protein
MLGKLDPGIKARSDDSGEGELTFRQIEKLCLTGLASDFGKDCPAVGAEPLRRKQMIGADKLAGALGTKPDHAPRHRRFSEGLDEPRFHQVQEAETERAVDLGKLALTDRRGCCPVLAGAASISL